MKKENRLPYVMITPARNESENLEKTIHSMIRQKILPKKWVIVSDGSTDGTDEIVQKYARERPWIKLMRMPEREERSFAAKVRCFNAGFESVSRMKFEIVGSLDADVSFERDYFEFLLAKFDQIPELGVAGTPFIESGYSSIGDSFEGEKHVPGGVQLFRRRCLENISGFVPNKAGGVDWIAVTKARMKGWKTQCFKEKVFYHHRKIGTAERSLIGSLFDYGQKDYYLGNHPLWEMCRITYRFFKQPYLTGGGALLAGYLWALLTRMQRPVSEELMEFHRQEEMQKLRIILKRVVRFKKIDKFDPASE